MAIELEQIERPLLLDSLDEESILGSAERIADEHDIDAAEVIDRIVELAGGGLLTFYRYADDGGFVDIEPRDAMTAIRRSPYEVFMAHTPLTLERLAKLSADKPTVA